MKKAIALMFQSAVAHELFSDLIVSRKVQCWTVSFKALSRMSSSPTYNIVGVHLGSVRVSKRCRA